MLTVLAAHRAGLVVALLPLLWRQQELTMALNRIGARAILTASRIDGVNHAQSDDARAWDGSIGSASARHLSGAPGHPLAGATSRGVILCIPGWGI